jgi:co-chaperonin GroES (HSP10)
MRIIFILFLFIYSMAYEVSITKIQNSVIKVDKYVKKGVSGIVICPYENKKIICARVVMFGKKGKLEVYDSLENDSFALPRVLPKVGDRIVLGKDYSRVMIVAPNQNSYLKVKSMLKDKTFISPDIFATFLDEIPTKKDFVNFAKKLDIGMYAFVLDKVYLVDAYSFYKIKKYDLNETYKYEKPFFVNYKHFKISSGIFSMFKTKIKDFEKYYKNLIRE